AGRHIGGAHGAKSDLAPAARMHFDDVVFGMLVLAGVAHSAARQRMQLLNRGLRYGQLGAFRVDEVERLAVAAHFLLVAVSEQGFAEDYGANPLLIDLNPFDAI